MTSESQHGNSGPALEPGTQSQAAETGAANSESALPTVAEQTPNGQTQETVPMPAEKPNSNSASQNPAGTSAINEANTTLTCPGKIFPVINNKSLGKTYKNLLQSFIQLEAGYGWQTGGMHLSARGQPPKVTAWINNEQKSFVLEPKNCEAFAEQW